MGLLLVSIETEFLGANSYSPNSVSNGSYGETAVQILAIIAERKGKGE
jgi:hypothetical protein